MGEFHFSVTFCAKSNLSIIEIQCHNLGVKTQQRYTPANGNYFFVDNNLMATFTR
ncbi:MAG: hypothetical protein RIQ62_721 [Bacteroidota bacterium]|jgi:hypothetical protein